MDFFTRLRNDDSSDETLATRRSEIMEFGEPFSEDSDVREFEVCKGLICTLD